MRLLLLSLAWFGLAGAASAAESRVLILGDSLAAGYGIAAHESWPSLLARRLEAVRCELRVVNASISGETSAGGRARVAKLLEQHRPAVLIVELGANDGLRGLPVDQLKGNLDAILQAGKQAGARVLVIGMRLPPNYGPAYTRVFEAGFAEVARRHQAALVPFLLEKIAADPASFQADGLHPVAAAQPALLDTVWPALKPLLGCTLKDR